MYFKTKKVVHIQMLPNIQSSSDPDFIVPIEKYTYMNK